MTDTRDLARTIVRRAAEAGHREAGRQANETGTVTDSDPLTVDIAGVEFDEDDLLWSTHVDTSGLDPGDTLAIMRSGDEYVVLSVLGSHEAPAGLGPVTASSRIAELEDRVAALEAAVAALTNGGGG